MGFKNWVELPTRSFIFARGYNLHHCEINNIKINLCSESIVDILELEEVWMPILYGLCNLQVLYQSPAVMGFQMKRECRIDWQTAGSYESAINDVWILVVQLWTIHGWALIFCVHVSSIRILPVNVCIYWSYSETTKLELNLTQSRARAIDVKPVKVLISIKGAPEFDKAFPHLQSHRKISLRLLKLARNPWPFQGLDVCSFFSFFILLTSPTQQMICNVLHTSRNAPYSLHQTINGTINYYYKSWHMPDSPQLLLSSLLALSSSV